MIAREHFQYFKTPFNPSLLARTTKLFDKNFAITPYQDYIKESLPFYQEILHEPISKLDKQVRQLIIIPTAELSMIPFELLITDKIGSGYRDLNYLFRKFSISGAHSTDFLFRENHQNQNRLGTIMTFAPIYDDAFEEQALKPTLTPLKWNQSEATSISKLLDGEALIGEFSTEENFKLEAAKYNILHLAMHALVDHKESMNSKLIFSANSDSSEDGLLHAFEILNMNLPAEMAVLSACNTGIGEVKAGEGVISLATAFAYAGVPSLVLSHWNVNDESTAKLMALFYEQLAKGERKDKALRNAKLAFLQEANELQAHPFYWGGFVLVGDSRPLNASKNRGLIPVLLIGIAIALIAGIIYRRKSNISS